VALPRVPGNLLLRELAACAHGAEVLGNEVGKALSRNVNTVGHLRLQNGARKYLIGLSTLLTGPAVPAYECTVGQFKWNAQRKGEQVPNPQSIDVIIESTISKAMLRIVPAIQRQVAAMVTEELEKGLAVRNGRDGRIGSQRRRRAPSRSRPRGEMTRWVADKRARRVPNFVIEMTDGLDTKKRIVAKYGEGVREGQAGSKACEVSTAGSSRCRQLPAGHDGERARHSSGCPGWDEPVGSEAGRRGERSRPVCARGSREPAAEEGDAAHDAELDPREPALQAPLEIGEAVAGVVHDAHAVVEGE